MQFLVRVLDSRRVVYNGKSMAAFEAGIAAVVFRARYIRANRGPVDEQGE